MVEVNLKDDLEKIIHAIDVNHENIGDQVQSVAKVTKVAVGTAVVRAPVAAPTGITAI